MIRGRIKKIILIQNISPWKGTENAFVEHSDTIIPMKIYQAQCQGSNHLAQIIYEAMVIQKNNNKIIENRTVMQQTLSLNNQSKINARNREGVGKIMHRSVEKNKIKDECQLKRPPSLQNYNLKIIKNSRTLTPKVSGKAQKPTVKNNKQNSETSITSETSSKQSKRSFGNRSISYSVRPFRF